MNRALSREHYVKMKNCFLDLLLQCSSGLRRKIICVVKAVGFVVRMHYFVI